MLFFLIQAFKSWPVAFKIHRDDCINLASHASIGANLLPQQMSPVSNGSNLKLLTFDQRPLVKKLPGSFFVHPQSRLFPWSLFMLAERDVFVVAISDSASLLKFRKPTFIEVYPLDTIPCILFNHSIGCRARPKLGLLMLVHSNLFLKSQWSIEKRETVFRFFQLIIMLVHDAFDLWKMSWLGILKASNLKFKAFFLARAFKGSHPCPAQIFLDAHRCSKLAR